MPDGYKLLENSIKITVDSDGYITDIDGTSAQATVVITVENKKDPVNPLTLPTPETPTLEESVPPTTPPDYESGNLDIPMRGWQKDL